MRKAYQSTIKFAVGLFTERYWLLDYLPTFFQKRDGVLLVRLDLIGDFVLWLDSAQAYRRLYPDQKITLAVNSICTELATALPHWDRVISINVHELRTNYLYRICILAKLRWSNFAIAIQPTFSREFIGDLIVRACQSKIRVGYFGDTHNITPALKIKTDGWYTQLIKNGCSNHMELNINAHFVRELGLRSFKSNVPVIESTEAQPRILTGISNYVVLAVGASWKPRMWPTSSCVELIECLQKEFNVHVVLCGSTSDRILCSQIEKTIGSNKITNLAGQTSLQELIEVIRFAKLVVSNESAPSHIAAATGTPVVCILGGGHFGRFWPYITEGVSPTDLRLNAAYPMDCFNCAWQCKYNPGPDDAVPCIANITVSNVLSQCKSALKDLQNQY